MPFLSPDQVSNHWTNTEQDLTRWNPPMTITVPRNKSASSTSCCTVFHTIWYSSSITLQQPIATVWQWHSKQLSIIYIVKIKANTQCKLTLISEAKHSCPVTSPLLSLPDKSTHNVPLLAYRQHIQQYNMSLLHSLYTTNTANENHIPTAQQPATRWFWTWPAAFTCNRYNKC